MFIVQMQAIDDLLIEVLLSIEDAADTRIPQLKTFIPSKKNNNISNWHSEHKYYRDKAQFWRSVWLSAGRPQNGQLHILMRRTRNVYHLHIRISLATSIDGHQDNIPSYFD